ncbi:barstar family protein [Streptomyces sp. NPDC051452]|uniref:barstar family protein n=1 Tax=Streptomyces sp. NPDC051452 TaxID=3365654 RepID=UPI00378F00F0
MNEDLAGRFTVVLELDHVRDKAGLMDAVARALALPDWFGRNWDALADSLADHTVWPEGAVERGLLILIRGWQPYAEARPGEWRTAQEVFGEAVDRTPSLTVLLALGGSSQVIGHDPGGSVGA